MTVGIETVSTYTSAAIQTAINKVIADTSGAGGVVMLPPGGIPMAAPPAGKSASITTSPKISLQGSGKQTSTLVAQGDWPVLDIIGAASANAPGSFQVNHIASPCLYNLAIEGGDNPAWSTKPMVRMYYAHTAEITGVAFRNKWGIGTLIGAECWDNTWSECRWDACGGSNQGLPSVLMQSADGATFPAFGSSTDATNDQRFFHCTWESFRDGALWTANPAGANGVGNLYLSYCKADQNTSALGDWFRFDTMDGVFVKDMDTATTGAGGAYAGTPFQMFLVKNCRSVVFDGMKHYQNSAQTDSLIHFDGTTGGGNRFVTLDVIETTQIGSGSTAFASNMIKITGNNVNYRWDFKSIPRYLSSNPLAIKPIFGYFGGAAIPTQLLKPIGSKSGAFSDASDIGTQEPGIPNGMAAIAGVDYTNNRLYVRYPDGTYHYATLT